MRKPQGARRDFYPAKLNTIGARIKRSRIVANVTQADLAAAMGISDALIGQWEADKTPGPRATDVLALATLLDVSPLYILTGQVELNGSAEPVPYGYTYNDLQDYLVERRIHLEFCLQDDGVDEETTGVVRRSLEWAEEQIARGNFDGLPES